MQRPIRDTLAASFVGSGITGVLYWLSGHISLAVVTGLCWLCGLKLALRGRYRSPASDTADTWFSDRWSVLAIGLINLAALVGVSPMLPISNELRLGLGFLVTGVGLVAYSAGSLAVLELSQRDSKPATTSTSETPSSPDGD